MSGNFHTSGCVTESDLKVIVSEHNNKLNYKIKSTLRKIHKLKRENLVLSDRRKSRFSEIFVKSQSNGWFIAISMLALEVGNISERIGKNGNKIQRLRTKISQLNKSLIPAVDE